MVTKQPLMGECIDFKNYGIHTHTHTTKILFSLNKDENSAICNNIVELGGHYVK